MTKISNLFPKISALIEKEFYFELTNRTCRDFVFASTDAGQIKAKYRKVLYKKEYALLLILLIVSLLAFSLFWANKSFFAEDNTQSQTQLVNGTNFSHRTTTFTIENYFPLRTYNFIPKVECYFFSNKTNGEVANLPDELLARNISINYVEVQYVYGQDVIQLPMRVDCPPYFYSTETFPMAKTLVTFDWEYNVTYSTADYYTINLLPPDDVLGKLPFFSFELVAKIFNKLIDGFYYFVFIGIGLVLSWTLFRKRYELRNAYKYLTNDFPQQPEKLKQNLDEFNHLQNQLGTIEEITLSLTIIFWRISVANWCKKHLKTAGFHNELAEEQLSNFIKESDVGLSDLVPNLRYVLVGLGFLASAGISFSWNVGALAPFLLSVVVFYLFLNIGSTFYVLRDSKKDLIWVLLILIVALLVLLLPKIIDSLRLIT